MSLSTRAALAILLTIGFYGLAVVVGVGLLAIPYIEWVRFSEVTPVVAIFCIGAGATILWSIIPRPVPFQQPGPRLSRDSQPRLFEQLDEVARLVDETTPKEVYLAADVNASVLLAGGILGVGGRRVMVLGMPLMEVLRRSEMRAVLAHEYGHFNGGDTSLAPLIHQTRTAVIRTARNVGRRSLRLRLLFVWYGEAFLRITQGISRSQELAADRRAATVVGARSLIQGLQVTQGAAAAFAEYFQVEFLPVVARGFGPPLLAGFRLFYSNRSVAGLVQRAVDEALQDHSSDPYDSHPPLSDRLAALAGVPSGPDPAEEPMAISLLDQADELDRLLVQRMVKPGVGLRQISWDAVPEQVHLTSWRKAVAGTRQAFDGVTVGALPEACRNLSTYGAWLASTRGGRMPPDQLRQAGEYLLGAALIVALVDNGWSLQHELGEPIRLRRGDVVLEPFWLVSACAGDAGAASRWKAEATRLGVSGLPL